MNMDILDRLPQAPVEQQDPLALMDPTVTAADMAWLHSQVEQPAPVTSLEAETPFVLPANWRAEVTASEESHQMEVSREAAHVAITNYLGYDPRAQLEALIFTASMSSEAEDEEDDEGDGDHEPNKRVGVGHYTRSQLGKAA